MTRNGRQHPPRRGGRTADPSREPHQANAQPTTRPDLAAPAAASNIDGQLLYRVEEAAQLLRLGRTTIYALIQDGTLRAVHIRRSCRITRAELERFTRRLDTPPVADQHAPADTTTHRRRRTATNQGELFRVDAPPDAP
jgi:excisionase family DNA binding protein